MKHLLFLLLTAFVLCTACKKENEMTISNNHDILRCKINRQDWKPAGGGPDIISPYRFEYYDYDGFFVLDASNSTTDTNHRGAIMMSLIDTQLGVNKIIAKNGVWFISNSDNTSGCKYYEILDTNAINEINIIEIDSINHFMIGEFQFSAINDCQDTIRVTDGYFDLNYFF